jgi:ubiquinone/menaquinone biosynthesis C-methylase UbiE
MTKDGFQLTGAAAQAYEDQKVPAMFGPLAQATLAHHEVNPDDVVLDVACGTGIVARTIRNLFGEQPRVIGIDLNQGMIDTARDVCVRDGMTIDFRMGDVTSMPFEDNEFTFVICQQGLQYFPDEDAAVRELRRVTTGGGRIVLTVWSRPSPLIVAMANSLRVHVGADVAEQSLAPFSWIGSETITSRMGEAGFVDIDLEELEVNRVLNDAAQNIPKEIMGTPVGPSVASMGQAVFDTVVEEMLDATEQYRSDDQLVIPQHTHLISAVAG